MSIIAAHTISKDLGVISKDLGSATDRDLVLTAASGLEGSFEELVRRYQRPISAYVYRMVGDYDAALDLTQEIFIKSTARSLVIALSSSFQPGFTRLPTTRPWTIYAEWAA